MELEQDGPCPKDYDKVDKVHALSSKLYEEMPAYLRPENPDTRWDDHPDCKFLPAARPYMSQIHCTTTDICFLGE